VKPLNQFIKVFKVLILGFTIGFGNSSLANTVSHNERVGLLGTASEVIFNNRVYTRSASWAIAPDIVICHGANIQIDEVESAIMWWQLRGYKFGRIIEKSPHERCDESGMIGFITIEPTDQSFDYSFLAITDTMTHNTSGNILSSRIRIRSDVNKERVLEHELGHSLGWSHINRRNHIMNSVWNRGGWDDSHLQIVEDANQSP